MDVERDRVREERREGVRSGMNGEVGVLVEGGRIMEDGGDGERGW